MRLAVDLCTCNFIREKQMLVFTHIWLTVDRHRFYATFCIFVRVLWAKTDWETCDNFMGCKIRHLRVLCYLGLEKQKEESYVGHFDNGSKIAQKNPSFYKNTRVAKKKLLLALSSACQFALPLQTHFPVTYWDILLQFCRQNWNLVNIGQKYHALYVWYVTITRIKTVR
jgi:hypothetical protein